GPRVIDIREVLVRDQFRDAAAEGTGPGDILGPDPDAVGFHFYLMLLWVLLPGRSSLQDPAAPGGRGHQPEPSGWVMVARMGPRRSSRPLYPRSLALMSVSRLTAIFTSWLPLP